MRIHWKGFCAFGFLLFCSLILGGCITKANFNQMAPIEEISKTVSIKLEPETSVYYIDNVLQGAVGFSAAVFNKDSDTIRIAHPTLCFPDDYQSGDIRRVEDSNNRSEILLKIIKPDGSIVILRDGHHFFDAETPDVLTIAPGEAKMFYIGWFFLNARGRWEDDALAAEVFRNRGSYKVQLLYRNLFSKAVSIDPSTNETSFIEAWTGEILSNEVSVTVN